MNLAPSGTSYSYHAESLS